MYVLVVLIVASLFVAVAFLVAFWWAVRSGQYDDTYTPSMRMLFEDPSCFDAKDSAPLSTRETK